MVSTGKDKQVICDGTQNGIKCRRTLNVNIPASIMNSFRYWETVLQQALDSLWTYNPKTKKIYCPSCSQSKRQ